MTLKVVLATKVPPRVVSEIDQLIESGHYLNKSDFLRAAARAEIEKRKVEESG